MYCLILGDSLAVGTAQALRAIEAEHCTVIARDGAATSAIIRASPREAFDTVILSAGTNDARASNLERRLATLRTALIARRVIWLAPYDRAAAARVVSVAMQHGDSWIDVGVLPSRDGIHPKNYRPLAITIGGAFARHATSQAAGSSRKSWRHGWIITPMPPPTVVFER